MQNNKRDLTFALGTLLIFWLALFLNTLIGDPAETLPQAPRILHVVLDIAQFAVWIMLGSIFVGVFFPVSYVLKERAERAEQLGFTRERLLPAVLLSVVVAGGMVLAFGLPGRLSGVERPGLLVLAALLTFAQPFFIYGWLQTRLEAGLGAIPAVVLAGLAFALIHVGSVALTALLPLAAAGLAMAIAFRLTQNVFAVFPLASGVALLLGPLGSAEVGVGQIVLLVIVLVVQTFAFTWVRGDRTPAVGAA